MGLDQINNITLENITGIINQTSLTNFLVEHNNQIFGGVYWFIIMLLVWFVLFRVANKVRDQILNNLMYSGAVVSILSLLLRTMGLLSDFLLWIPIIITILLAVIIWATKDK